MGSSSIDKNCDKCKVYKESLELLKSKLRDKKLIYEDSIKTYRKALTDREYELLMRECEVVKEMDNLKSIISTLTKELEGLGAKVSIDGVNVKVSIADANVKVNNVSNVSNFLSNNKVVDLGIKKATVGYVKLSDAKTVKQEVKERDNKNVKQNVNLKEKVKDNDKGIVKKPVKEELKKSECMLEKDVKLGENGNISIVLPEVLGLTDAQRVSLTYKAKNIEDYIKNEAKVYKGGVSYPCRRLSLIKKHTEFFISMMLLVENIPKARGSYAWTKATNILKECDDYKLVVGDFLNDTNFKLTYLNIRNWYMSLVDILENME